MYIIPDNILEVKLRKMNLGRYAKGFNVSGALYEKYLEESKVLHPTYDESSRHRWAAYASLLSASRSKSSPTIPWNLVIDSAWKILVTSLLAGILWRVL